MNMLTRGWTIFLIVISSVLLGALLIGPSGAFSAASNYTPPCTSTSNSCLGKRVAALESLQKSTTPSSTTVPTTTIVPTTTTVPTTTVVPTTTSATSSGVVPGQILDLTNWYLTLPTPLGQTSGDPDTVHQPALNSYTSQYFDVDGSAVRFTAPVGGAHTANSEYPRSELREMTNSGQDQASWSSSIGDNIMTLREAITQLPPVKPQVVMGQIHNSSDDVIEIVADGSNGKLTAPVIKVRYKGSSQSTPVIASVSLKQFFDIKIEATAGKITIYGNNVLTHTFSYSGSGLYFKAGAYTQSNPSKGDAATAIGQVEISSLNVSHS